MDIDTAAEVAVTYLPRSPGDGAGEEHARGERLTAAVRDWATAWTAEAGGDAVSTGATGADVDHETDSTTETGILAAEGAEGGGLRVWVAADATIVRGLRRAAEEQGLDRKSLVHGVLAAGSARARRRAAGARRRWGGLVVGAASAVEQAWSGAAVTGAPCCGQQHGHGTVHERASAGGSALRLVRTQTPDVRNTPCAPRSFSAPLSP